MSYQKNTWVDHIIDPSTGEVVQQGTKVTANRLNNLESGVEKAHQLVESLAQSVVGSSVISGLTFTASGLTASWTAGTAYVNGVRFDVSAGSIALNPTQGQYIYLDSDGVVKITTNQATAQAKCLLWYFATDASSVITSNDRRAVVDSAAFVKQTEVAANGANKIPRLNSTGKGEFSITGDADTVDGKHASDFVQQSEVATNGANKVLRLGADGKANVSITGDAASVGGKTVGAGPNQIPTRDATGKLDADTLNGLSSSAFVRAGSGNQDVNKVSSVTLETDTRTVVLTYTNGKLTKVEEKDGSTVVKTTNLTYNGDGTLATVQEIAGGATVTKTLNYTAGQLTSVTKVVT